MLPRAGSLISSTFCRQRKPRHRHLHFDGNYRSKGTCTSRRPLHHPSPRLLHGEFCWRALDVPGLRQGKARHGNPAAARLQQITVADIGAFSLQRSLSAMTPSRSSR